MAYENWKWTDSREAAALHLAQGHTEAETAEKAGVTPRTIRSWKTVPEFMDEVDRLTLLTGLAMKGERARYAKRVARQFVQEDGSIKTNRDSLDWLKFLDDMTDGAVQELLITLNE